MTVPKYPPQLSSSAWTRAKGVGDAKIETRVGPLLKAAEAHYKTIKWSVFDTKKVFPAGALAQVLQLAAVAAENEYTNKVRGLAQKVKRVAKAAEQAEGKLRTGKASAKLVAYAKSVATAAQQYGDQVLALKVDVAQMKKFANTPLVEALVGGAWFDQLERITIHNNATLRKWVTSKELAISPADFTPNAELADAQERFGEELGIFRTALEKVKGLRHSRMEVPAAKKLLIGYWHHVGDAFLAMKPGMQGIQREWGVTFNGLAGGREKADAWKARYRAAHALNAQVEQLLFNAEPDINELDEAIDQLSLR